MVKQLFPNIILIENKENFGFSKGNNIGVAKAKGDYLCILNPDTVVGETTFETLLEFAEKQQNLGIIGCKLIDGKGVFLQESKRNIPTPMVSIKKMLGFSNTYYAKHIEPNEIGKADIFVGAFMVLKREVYNNVGGFDEDYFMYGEDIDLSYKILKANYINYYNGSTTIIHFKGESTLKDKTYAKRFFGAMQIFYNKHFKSNIVFDMLVWFGIKFSIFLSKEASVRLDKVYQHAILSYGAHASLNTQFPFEVDLVQDFTNIKPNTQVIFDANTLSHSEIIDYLDHSDKNKGLTFKILPNGADFIIGSNSSKSRGEVIKLL